MATCRQPNLYPKGLVPALQGQAAAGDSLKGCPPYRLKHCRREHEGLPALQVQAPDAGGPSEVSPVHVFPALHLLMSSDPNFLSVIMRAVLNLPALHMPLQAAATAARSAHLRGCLCLQI